MMLRQAWQSWKGARTVFALAVIALAIGIASTTAIYTIVNAVMLKPLAYEHGDRYAQLFSATAGDQEGRGSLMLADLLVYQQAQSFDLFGWFKPQNFNVTSPGLPQHVEGAAATTTLARSLGIRPMLGQWFQDEHGAVISRALWTRLGSDPHLLDERCRQLRYVNAGHNPPYLVRASEIQELSIGGSVIGLFADMQYEEGTVDMQPGDLLAMFTDGVTEALNVAGDEFGEERLQTLIRTLAPLPVEEISSRLLDELRTWTKGAVQHDDCTFVLMKMREITELPPSTLRARHKVTELDPRA